MRAIARAHAITRAISLMRVKKKKKEVRATFVYDTYCHSGMKKMKIPNIKLNS